MGDSVVRARVRSKANGRPMQRKVQRSRQAISEPYKPTERRNRMAEAHKGHRSQRPCGPTSS